MSIFLNGAEINSLMWNGADTTGVYNGEVIWGSSSPSVHTLTLQTDGHGTLTANTLTGYPGDTITLTPTYNTYYRFNNYSYTGGSVAGNVFTFGDSDATAKANFKVNAFTATGGWDKGNDNKITGTAIITSYKTLYNSHAVHGAHTGDIPAAWYSSFWKPSNVSGYSMNIRAKMTLQHTGGGDLTFRVYTVLNGSTTTNGQAWTNVTANPQYMYYDKTLTTSYCSTGGYRLVGQYKSNATASNAWGANYLSSGTNGTWTATGIAP